jgi:O-antigen ligase
LKIVAWFAGYRAWQKERDTRSLANPWIIGAILVLLWVEFRWWPAILMTGWLGFCFIVSRRKLRSR